MAGTKVLATNRKASHEYFIEETYECGIELKGTEVKSIRLGSISYKQKSKTWVLYRRDLWMWNRIKRYRSKIYKIG